MRDRGGGDPQGGPGVQGPTAGLRHEGQDPGQQPESPPQDMTTGSWGLTQENR